MQSDHRQRRPRHGARCRNREDEKVVHQARQPGDIGRRWVLAAAGRPVRWLAARTMAGGNSILHCKWELFVFVIVLGGRGVAKWIQPCRPCGALRQGLLCAQGLQVQGGVGACRLYSSRPNALVWQTFTPAFEISPSASNPGCEPLSGELCVHDIPLRSACRVRICGLQWCLVSGAAQGCLAWARCSGRWVYGQRARRRRKHICGAKSPTRNSPRVSASRLCPGRCGR